MSRRCITKTTPLKSPQNGASSAIKGDLYTAARRRQTKKSCWVQRRGRAAKHTSGI
jgi:hypothetical protein